MNISGVHKESQYESKAAQKKYQRKNLAED